MQKKTLPIATQAIHTLAERLSDAKVIISIIITVVLALAGTIISAFNLAYNLKSAPLISKVSAIDERVIILEKTLPIINENTQTIADFINQPKIKVLRPVTNIKN